MYLFICLFIFIKLLIASIFINIRIRWILILIIEFSISTHFITFLWITFCLFEIGKFIFLFLIYCFLLFLQSLLIFILLSTSALSIFQIFHREIKKFLCKCFLILKFKKDNSNLNFTYCIILFFKFQALLIFFIKLSDSHISYFFPIFRNQIIKLVFAFFLIH
jgi:hypothetical protein